MTEVIKTMVKFLKFRNKKYEYFIYFTFIVAIKLG